MITLALHHDESVFVYLSETSTNKKKIEQLGFFSTDFHLNRNFLFRPEAKNRLGNMFKDLLDVLKANKQECIFSIPADLCYFSFYDDIPGDRVQEMVDKDLWLTELKLGKAFIEQSDCQVKVIHKKGGLVSFTAVYFPNMLHEYFSGICREHDCRLSRIGINLFNNTEIADALSPDHNYWLLSLENHCYELLHMREDTIRGFSRFCSKESGIMYLAKQGEIPGELCQALLQRDTEILQKYSIIFTSAGSDMRPVKSFREKMPFIRVLNPMLLDTYYEKPVISYDEQYDTVFSCALGALI